MTKFIGLVLSVSLLMSMVSGCEAQSAKNNTGVPENSSEISETDTPEENEAEESEFPRTYIDARGKEVTLEKKPERIAVTTWMITENLLALETPPVAADTVDMMSSWAAMKDYFQNYRVEDLGATNEINLEKLTELAPDLILATTANEKIYDQLEKIAPVIVFDSDTLFKDWQNAVSEIDKVIGVEEEAEQFINTMMEQVAYAREQVSDLGKTVGFVRGLSKGLYSLSVEQLSMYYDTDKGLGLTVPDNWAEETGTISLEAFSEINPDYIFISSSEGQKYFEELEKNSVWNSLTAVKENHVFSIDTSGLTGGPLATKYGVQTVLDALTK